MVKSLDEQIKSLQERQAQLKARENDLMARRRERERRARTKRLIEVGAMAESAAGFEGGDERAKEHIARLVQLGSLVEAMCSTDVMDNYTSREDLRATVAKAIHDHDMQPRTTTHGRTTGRTDTSRPHTSRSTPNAGPPRRPPMA